MLFSVYQSGLLRAGLVWEYGRVLGRSRRKTLAGRLMFVPGAWVLFMGTVFTLGMALSVGDPMTDDEEMGMLLMVPLTLLLLLWGVSWTGLTRPLAALTRLVKLRRVEETTRFYLSYVEDIRDMLRMNYPYEAVRDVYEGRQAFFLLLEGGGVLLLPKECFTMGESGAFRRWMDEKCGKPVILLKI